MNKTAQAPLIIIGMHRSGTTMLARMLREMGLFIGWSLQENFESRFFLEINRSVMRASNGTWDNPAVIDASLADAGMRKKITETMRADLRSFFCLYYLGPRYFLRYRSVFRFDKPWGWKEPQNTILLPLWRDVFPSAKVLHIYRNGVDVAASLARRERTRIERICTERKARGTRMESQREQLKSTSLLVYLVQKLRARYEKMNPLYKYSSLGVRPCLSLERGFQLWSYYVEKAFSWIELNPRQSRSEKYEDFLLDPAGHLQEVAAFCGLEVDRDRVKRIADTADAARSSAFEKDAFLAQFYEHVRENPWMRKLGYSG
jgi:hypothetical protein